MEIREVELSELKPAPYNPRHMTEDAMAGLTASIQEFGLVEPIVWNKQTGHVVGGHQRLRVLEKEGITKTTVVVVDLDPAKEKALNIALNSRHIAGLWTSGLGPILEDLRKTFPDLSKRLQFSKLERFDVRTAIAQEKRRRGDPLATPKPARSAFTKPGDMWHLGKHRLLCGDCTQEPNWSKLFNGKRADLCLTDPPYCTDYQNMSRGLELASRKESHGEEYKDPQDARKLLAFINLLPTDMLIMTFTIKWRFELWDTTRDWDAIEECVWVKDNLVLNAFAYYKQQHENIFFFRRKKAEHKGIWEVPHDQGTVFAIKKAQRNPEHPTIRPYELWQKLMTYHSHPGHLIVDPFMGSGTTMIAAEDLDRVCYGMEIEPVYVEVAVRRWEHFTNRHATLFTQDKAVKGGYEAIKEKVEAREGAEAT